MPMDQGTQLLIRNAPYMRDLLYIPVLTIPMIKELLATTPRIMTTTPTPQEFLQVTKCSICYTISFPGRSTQCNNGHIICSFCMYYSLIHAENPGTPRCAICRVNSNGLFSRHSEFVSLSRFSENKISCRINNCNYRSNSYDILTHSLICGTGEFEPTIRSKNQSIDCPEFIHHIFMCVHCKKIPHIDDMITMCPNGHNQCRQCTITSSGRICPIPGCLLANDSKNIVGMEIFILLNRVNDFPCHFTGCEEKNDLYSALLHHRCCEYKQNPMVHMGCMKI